MEEITLDLHSLTKVGCGGSKCAYKLNSLTVLVLPSTENQNWEGVVEGEIEVSRFMTSIGILNPRHRKIMINGRLAYISASFEGLSRSGIAVMDIKNPTISIQESLFFGHDLFEREIWVEMMEPLLEDILLLRRYNVWLSNDNSNFAIVNFQVPNLTNRCYLRYFAFDFTDKSGRRPRFLETEPYELDVEDALINARRYRYFLRNTIEICVFEELSLTRKLFALNEREIDLVEELTTFFVKRLVVLFGGE